MSAAGQCVRSENSAFKEELPPSPFIKKCEFLTLRPNRDCTKIKSKKPATRLRGDASSALEKTLGAIGTVPNLV